MSAAVIPGKPPHSWSNDGGGGLTISQYHTAVSEAANYAGRGAYISDLALSTIWGAPDGAPIPAQRLEDLGQIWDAVHRDVKQIAADAGMSQRKLAERFLIPYRTVEDWSAGKRSCPGYLLLMMQQVLGLLTIEIK